MTNARFSVLQARAVSDPDISDAQFRTLAALGMYADKDGWCYPSLTTIGKNRNKSKQAAGRDIIALKKAGYLEVQSRYDSETKSRHSNLYRLKFDLPRQRSVDTPSTSEVDTPSTSEVDVNVPVNAPNNSAALEKTNKKDMVDMLIDFQIKPNGIRQAIHEYFKINVLSWETKTARQFMEWAIREGITPEQIKIASERWRMDKYFSWQKRTLANIAENWQLLMDGKEQQSNPSFAIDENGIPETY